MLFSKHNRSKTSMAQSWTFSLVSGDALSHRQVLKPEMVVGEKSWSSSQCPPPWTWLSNRKLTTTAKLSSLAAGSCQALLSTLLLADVRRWHAASDRRINHTPGNKTCMPWLNPQIGNTVIAPIITSGDDALHCRTQPGTRNRNPLGGCTGRLLHRSPMSRCHAVRCGWGAGGVARGRDTRKENRRKKTETHLPHHGF